MAAPLAFTHTVTERFLRYVVIDTQSDPESPTCPSTEKQKDLGSLLAAELKDMGLADAHLDAHGYVYATIPANTDKKVPVICFCSHMDTSPDCTGANVKPQLVKNYQGGDIVLPADPTQVIRAADHPAPSLSLPRFIRLNPPPSIRTLSNSVPLDQLSIAPLSADGNVSSHCTNAFGPAAQKPTAKSCRPCSA